MTETLYSRERVLINYLAEGNLSDSLCYGYQMYLESKESSRRSNVLYNALAFFALEYIGPANLSLTLGTVDYVDRTTFFERKWSEMRCLLTLLCKSRKSSVIRDIYYTYCQDRGRVLAVRKGIAIDDFVSYRQEFYLWAYDDPPGNYQLMAENSLQRLTEGNFFTFMWLGIYLQETENKKIAPRSRKRDPVEIFWLYFRQLLHPDIFEILYRHYRLTTRDKYLPTMLALYILFFQLTSSVVDIFFEERNYRQNYFCNTDYRLLPSSKFILNNIAPELDDYFHQEIRDVASAVLVSLAGIKV